MCDAIFISDVMFMCDVTAIVVYDVTRAGTSISDHQVAGDVYLYEIYVQFNHLIFGTLKYCLLMRISIDIFSTKYHSYKNSM